MLLRFRVFVIKKCLSQNPYRIFIAHGPDLTSRPQNAVMLPLPVKAAQTGSGQKHARSEDETDSPMVDQSDWGRRPSWYMVRFCGADPAWGLTAEALRCMGDAMQH